MAGAAVAPLAHAAGDLNAQDAVGDAIKADGVAADSKQVAELYWFGNAERAQGVGQAAEMAVEQVGFAVVNPECFKRTIAVHKSAVEHRHHGGFLRDKFAIQKNVHDSPRQATRG